MCKSSQYNFFALVVALSYGLKCVPHPPFICWGPNPYSLKMCLYLQIGSFRLNEAFGMALIPHDGGPSTKRRLGHRHAQKGDWVKIPEEDSHLQAKERAL